VRLTFVQLRSQGEAPVHREKWACTPKISRPTDQAQPHYRDHILLASLSQLETTHRGCEAVNGVVLDGAAISDPDLEEAIEALLEWLRAEYGSPYELALVMFSIGDSL
jgi:hypothetical protein